MRPECSLPPEGGSYTIPNSASRSPRARTRSVRLQAERSDPRVRTRSVRLQAEGSDPRVRTRSVRLQAEGSDPRVRTRSVRLQAEGSDPRVRTRSLRHQAEEGSDPRVRTCSFRLQAEEGSDPRVRTCSLRLQAEVLLIALVLAGCAATTSGANDDATISTRVKIALLDDPQLGPERLDARAFQGVVTLSGTVTSEAEEHKAIAVAKTVRGVKAVKSEIKIKIQGIATARYESDRAAVPAIRVLREAPAA
jgi:hypothetical protein